MFRSDFLKRLYGKERQVSKRHTCHSVTLAKTTTIRCLIRDTGNQSSIH